MASDATNWGGFEGAGQREFEAFLSDQFPVMPHEWRPQARVACCWAALCATLLAGDRWPWEA